MPSARSHMRQSGIHSEVETVAVKVRIIAFEVGRTISTKEVAVSGSDSRSLERNRSI